MHKKAIEVFHLEKNRLIHEDVPCSSLLFFLYRNESLSGRTIRSLLCKSPLFSSFIGFWSKRFWTKWSIQSFVKRYDIDLSPFEKTQFSSFNDFFIRKLKSGSRELANANYICPCDGRYLFIENICEDDTFYVKGQKLSLKDLLQDEDLVNTYKGGSMILSRLAPQDYHCFHSPAKCTIKSINPLKQALYSVNPIALRESLYYLYQNKKVLFEMSPENAKEFLFIPVGATNVGSIHYDRNKMHYDQGEEIGYFSFGGSMVISLFQKGEVSFNKEFIKHSRNGHEVLMKMGESFL